jgi:hypothetical protein
MYIIQKTDYHDQSTMIGPFHTITTAMNYLAKLPNADELETYEDGTFGDDQYVYTIHKLIKARKPL